MPGSLTRVEGVQGVFSDGKHLLTVNGAPGTSVYGEKLVSVDGVEYRRWDPNRSKLAAMIMLGAECFGLEKNSKVLYLGAASGTTASHVSDIVSEGLVCCVEISERSFRDLVKVCETRKNMIPLLADANMPEEIGEIVEAAEFVYQDIAQRNQVDIFLRNMAAFEAERGILMLKSRSIDVNRRPREVFREVRKSLARSCLHVKQVIELQKYSKDHAAFIAEA